MSPITVTLTSSSRVSHVPLAALGYALRRANVLEPLVKLELPIKAIDHTPAEKLVTGLVLILAGGRAMYQTNWLLRPNTRLACAWGQAEFAEQSTISDTFDALDQESLLALQTAFAAITRRWSQTCQHDFRRGDLILDGDLTGLPASRHAEGSRKGYFAGKKIATDDKSRGSPPNRMANRWGRSSSQARKKARIACNRWSA
jgi:hypothetical protein